LVPLNVNFSSAANGVGAFTLYIRFDPKVMTFSSLNNQALNEIGANVVGGNTVLIYWTGNASYLNGKLLDLNFVYHGGDGSFDFVTVNNEVSDPDGRALAVTYTNGSLQMIDLDPAVTIAEVQSAQGQTVNVPVTVEAFYNVAGFLLEMEFEDPSVLQGTVSLQNVNAGLGGNLTSNFSGGNKMIVSWAANLSGNNISLANDQKLFDLRFAFSEGTSNIVFNVASELNQNLPPLYPPFENVNFTNGAITDGIQYFNLNLQADPNNIGASLTGAGTYAVGQTVNIGTTVPNGYAFDGWTGAQNNLLADATNPSTSFVMPANDVIFTANFIQVFSVNGTLKYANTTGAVRPITNSTVYLKSADGLTTIATTTTHATTGAYVFENVPAGSYQLTASTTKVWGGVNVIDYARVRLYVLTGNPSYTGIYFQAADVDNNGIVNVIDYARIRNRVLNGNTSGWVSFNWILQELSVTINQSIENIDILGICIGDVDASYYPSN
jgi:uncharacterized repeat protein (TIGR02543 family)